MTARGFALRAGALATIVIVGLAWPAVGSVLPDLDALLAPGGASPAAALGALVCVVSRVVYVVLAPGVAAVIATDLAWRTTRPESRVSEPPCGSSSSRR